MITSVPWLDLSDAQQEEVLAGMEEAFGKPVRDRARFCRGSCRVYFYRPRRFGDWTGAAITWSLRGQKGEYMDKFFVRRRSKGEGTRFLQEWVQVCDRGVLVWRTDAVLAERFYGRLPEVGWLGRHGDYIYQGVGTVGDQEALLEWIRLPSAF